MQTELVERILGDRHLLDAIARAAVYGERGLGAMEDAVADDIASMMISRLAAAGAPGHQRVAHLPVNCPERWQQIEERYGRPFLKIMVRRTDKHLGYLALLALTDVDQEPPTGGPPR
jgi:hypothetical protein